MDRMTVTPEVLRDLPEDHVFKKPVVVTGFERGTRIVRIMVNCNKTSDAEALVRVDSDGVRIGLVSVVGVVNPEDERHWVRNVANGVLVLGDDCEIDWVTAKNVHTPVTLRGLNGVVSAGTVDTFSGDGAQLVNDGCKVLSLTLSNSVQIFPYEQFHRDVVQAWKYGGGTLRHVLIRGVMYRHPEDSLYPPPQGIGGFDGEYDGVTVEDCELMGVHPEHGVSLGLARNTLVSNVKTDANIRFGDRKGLGQGCNNQVVGCEAADICFEDGSQAMVADETGGEVVHDVKWLDSLKNTKAKAIVEADYHEAAVRLSCEVAAIKAVFIVESAGSGFNRDGSVKCLYERHLTRREVKARKLPYRKIAKVLGGALISRWAGGYKGGVAEYWRIAQTISGIVKAGVTQSADEATDIAIRSASWGKPQILGKNCQLAGYESAADMVEAFHRSEKAHLDAFVSFVEKTGLDQHLRNKDWLAFAKGYNGKRCCDKGSKRDYSALIAAEYARQSGQPVEFKPTFKSRILQGNSVSASGIVAGGGTGVTVLVESLSSLKEKGDEVVGKVEAIKTQAAEIKEQAAELTAGVSDMKDRVIEVKDQAVEVLAQNADMMSMIADMRWWLYGLAALLVLSLLGNVYSIYARLDDRRKGRN